MGWAEEGLEPRLLTRLSKPGSKAGRLQRKVLELILGPRHARAGALPTSNRFLLYELEQMGILDKKASDGRKRSPGTDLSEALMRLRKIGLIPWDWIVDETRALVEWEFSPSVYQYVLSAIEDARINCWGDELPPLILTESRSLAGVLRRIAGRYLCPIAATNGQVGGFLHTEIIPLMLQGRRRVLYLGDEDPSGHQIERNTKRVIEAELPPELRPLEWERLALTEQQVRRFDIPPIVKTDNRFKGGKTQLAYETEALSQTLIQDLLIDRLDALLPEPLEDVLAREQEQRDRLAALLADIEEEGE